MAIRTTARILGTRSGKMTNSEILEAVRSQRTKCVVYSRVMGYHRPVEGFNVGKKGEHKERAFFEENKLKRIVNGKF
nr:MAG TPA: anaerobic ribonucleoside triphosphate reductase [Caudoviricetes sp.]